MKIHPDWSNNGSVAVTFDDDDDSETYSDFSRFLSHFNINFTTFKLRGAKTASMVIPVSVKDTNEEKVSEPDNSDSVAENENEDDTVENNVVKKKKKKSS